MSSKWNRIQKINPNATMYGAAGFTNDIIQGGLGDCYFLGGIASVAEDDERIKKVFINDQTNKAGIYAFNVFVRGLETIVTVDESILVNNKNIPLFAKIGQDNSMWGPILEKAWAKVNGNFERIEAGYGLEAFSFLTNSPSRYFNVSKLSVESLY